MKSVLMSASLLLLTFTQTACLTTVHSNPHIHDASCGHEYPRERTVRVYHPRKVYVPVRRPPPTVVTVRRY